MANPYSKYTGARVQPVPAGFIQAYGNVGKLYAQGLAGLGKGIGEGIEKAHEAEAERAKAEAEKTKEALEKYEEDRKERATLQGKGEAYFGAHLRNPELFPLNDKNKDKLKDMNAMALNPLRQLVGGLDARAALRGEMAEAEKVKAEKAKAQMGHAALIAGLDIKPEIKIMGHYLPDEDVVMDPSLPAPPGAVPYKRYTSYPAVERGEMLPSTAEAIHLAPDMEAQLKIMEQLEPAAGADMTAKVAAFEGLKKTELWKDASDAEKKAMTERAFGVEAPADDKTTLQKNILEFNNKLLAMKANSTWTEEGEAQLRGDYGLTSKAEIDLDDLSVKLKKAQLEKDEWKFDPVAITIRDEAGNKLPYGFIKTSREAGMYVQLNPGVGLDKGNFSIDANRLAAMMKQYAAGFNFRDRLGDLITRDMKTVSPQEKATIDATAMLIMGMQRNMGVPVSQYESVVTPGTKLKPALPAPGDKDEVDRRQGAREKTEEEKQKDAMDALKNRGAPNPNAPKR